MKKILEGVTRITTAGEFDILTAHIETLIYEATEGGYFSDPDESNEYTKEIARLGKLGARYEDEFLNLSINIKPMSRKIEQLDKQLVFA
jgi:hypothetical protein